jgi:predicted metal-binding transcription factor (methanogenesis marker protein 9)
MKKIVFAVMAMVAIGFTACGNKTQQAEVAVDSTAIVDSLASAAAQTDIDAISALLNGGDATKLQEALAAVKEKIANLIKENPEVAKEYVAKVQDFLKENADKVKAIVGDNAAVQTAVSAITDTKPADIVNGFLNSVGEAATEAKDAAVDAANQKVEEGKQAVEDKANEVKDAAKQKANDAIDNAAKDVKKGLGL